MTGAGTTDRTLRAMGTDVRLIGTGVDRAEDWLRRYDAALSRFAPESELRRLNADPRPVVAVSPLVLGAVRAALWGARRSGGLVDPTLGVAIVAAGYDSTWTGPAEPIAAALAAAPPRRPAAPSDGWRRIRLGAGTVGRPPGVALDTGGTGKGLAADVLAAMISGTADCGGDVRVQGTREIHVEHPLTGDTCERFVVTDGAVATSGVDRRLWRGGHGPAHHLLDPSTGRPAWTGLVTATALAPTALEAEVLAKCALLRGSADPLVHGGLVVREDGEVVIAGRRPAAVRLRRAA